MPEPGADSSEARRRMVRHQLEGRGVRDARVLAAMGSVAREAFVPAALAAKAYDDGPLGIGLGQTISQPYVVARMAEAAEIEPGDRVLEVGTGSGYAAAVLATLAGEVHTIERHAALADEARERLAGAGFRNVSVRVGDGSLGLPAKAPFDAILVAAMAPRIPLALAQQLAPGGRLVFPVGLHADDQWLVRARRLADGTLREERLFPVRFVPLVGLAGFPPGPLGAGLD